MAAILVGEEPYSFDPAVSESSNRVPIISGSASSKNGSRKRIVLIICGIPGELKHLSNPRKINHERFRQ
jgi:hypothetical protein